jgi:hypothetical protein
MAGTALLQKLDMNIIRSFYAEEIRVAAHVRSARMITFIMVFSSASVRDPQVEPLLAKAISTGMLLKLRSIRRDAHEPEDSCLVHASAACLSSREIN